MGSLASVDVTFLGLTNPVKYLLHASRCAGDEPCGVPFQLPPAIKLHLPTPSELPNAPVNGIVYDAATTPATLYVATDIGVFTSADNGASWSVLGQEMPYVVVTSLRLIGRFRVLRAGTHGRSAWDLQLTNAPLPKRRQVQVTSE